jgi:hypothetical protein
MKIIGTDLFGELYDKLYEYLSAAGFSGIGIKEYSVIQILESLWKEGKHWDTITIIICYHYTRDDAAVIRYGEQSVSFPKNASLREICKSLGIQVRGIDKVKINLEEFTKEYNQIDEKLPVNIKDKKSLMSLLDFIPCGDRKHILKCWKHGMRWETIVIMMVCTKTKLTGITIETDRGTYNFKKGDTSFDILEELENADRKD